MMPMNAIRTDELHRRMGVLRAQADRRGPLEAERAVRETRRGLSVRLALAGMWLPRPVGSVRAAQGDRI